MRLAMFAAISIGVFNATTTPLCWGQVINEDLKLLPSDGATGNSFGWTIAIDNGIVAVGAYQDDDNGTWSGSAYLFDAPTGAQIAKLLPSDGATGDKFGHSIAIDNGIVAVGAEGDDDNGSYSGSAYLFDASTGAQIAKLLPRNGWEDSAFGNSIAIDNGIVAVGAYRDDDNGSHSGSAYLFDASTGAQIAKLLPSDGATGDYFGWSIAIDNGIVAVGARRDDDNGPYSGSAYLFDASTGAQIAKLLPRNGWEDDAFGYSIAIDDGIVAVGAYRNRDNNIQSGAAYLFDASTGAQLAKLAPDDGAAVDFFGWSIAIDNGIVAVGAAYDDDNGDDSGSAYLFEAATGAQLAKLLPSDGVTRGYFGTSIAANNGIVAVGAYGDDDNGSRSGSAYLFGVNTIVDCLDLTVRNLIAGDIAIFTISKGTPGARAATVYGTKPGNVSVNDYAGYCATFGIAGVKQDNVIGGLNRTFDADGEIVFGLKIPGNLSGQRLFFQSAQHGTCPDECMSNLVEAVVQ
ncbi:MAG: hypothetical protein HND57_13110 [Planctomycetes bacterium]|nr:hypothetical protein [Planctomycetota bacterium]